MVRWRKPPRALVAVALLLVLGVLAGACSSSHYAFPSNKRLGVYLKVPTDWAEIPKEDLSVLYTQAGKEPSGDGYALLKTITWERAWDSSRAPEVGHLVLGAADAPVVRVNVRTLVKEEQSLVSIEDLKTLVYAAYTDDFKAYKELIRQPGTSALVNPDFEPLDERPYGRSGFFGVREVFKVRLANGGLYDIGFIAVVDDARTHLYTLVVHCNNACFSANSKAVASVLDSFTVRKV